MTELEDPENNEHNDDHKAPEVLNDELFKRLENIVDRLEILTLRSRLARPKAKPAKAKSAKAKRKSR